MRAVVAALAIGGAVAVIAPVGVAVLGAASAPAAFPSRCGAPVQAAVEGEGAERAARALIAAGWPREHLRTALMVVGAESGFDPKAGNRLADGRTHVGLLQISSLHVALVRKYGGDRTDPVANARMGLELWEGVGRRWSPTWEAFTLGMHGRYAAEADRALAAIGNDVDAVALPATACTAPDVPLGNRANTAALSIYVPCGEGPGQLVDGIRDPIRVCALFPGMVVNSAIADSVRRLVDEAQAAGLNIGGTGWRSHQRQRELYAQNCGSGRCSPPTAEPGTSRHEDGAAVDLTCNGALIRSRSSPCFTFLAQRAPQYGLHNLPSEPWHWSDSGG